MKQIQGSVRVKIEETFMHGPNFFLFHFFSFSTSFPKLTIFTILRLYMACLRDIKLKLVEKFHISASPLYYSLYNLIGEHEITKLKKYICFESRKKDTKRSTKTHEWNGISQRWTIWYFQQCTCVNAIYFAPVVTTTYRMKNNKSSTRGLNLETSVLARACAQLLHMLYISTHLSIPHGENI